jgi:hypothetical protein
LRKDEKSAQPTKNVLEHLSMHDVIRRKGKAEDRLGAGSVFYRTIEAQRRNAQPKPFPFTRVGSCFVGSL